MLSQVNSTTVECQVNIASIVYVTLRKRCADAKSFGENMRLHRKFPTPFGAIVIARRSAMESLTIPAPSFVKALSMPQFNHASPKENQELSFLTTNGISNGRAWSDASTSIVGCCNASWTRAAMLPNVASAPTASKSLRINLRRRLGSPFRGNGGRVDRCSTGGCASNFVCFLEPLSWRFLLLLFFIPLFQALVALDRVTGALLCHAGGLPQGALVCLMVCHRKVSGLFKLTHYPPTRCLVPDRRPA